MKNKKVGKRILKGGAFSIVKLIEKRAPPCCCANIFKKAKFMEIIFD